MCLRIVEAWLNGFVVILREAIEIAISVTLLLDSRERIMNEINYIGIDRDLHKILCISEELLEYP